jgi:phenylacetate-CoA ligase
MGASERARSLAFWTLDRLHGGHVLSHIRDLERLEAHPELLPAYQAERLGSLLSHACRTTAYYRQFEGARELRDFPLLSKRTIRERHDDFISSAYPPEALSTRTTSGSYGTPLAFRLTEEKRYRHQAEIIHYARWVGYNLGARHVQTRSTVVPSRRKLWMLNQAIMNPTHMTEEWLAAQRDMLIRERVKLVVSFPSVLAALAAYCEARGDTPAQYSLRGVIATAELLREEVRSLIESTFGCPVLSRYTTEELGVLAQECPQGRQHHLNQACYVIEVLDKTKDRPVEPGQPGRVVVTDLWSHAMPLIRYDLGDVAVLGERCTCGREGPVLTSIEGRIVETIYDAGGGTVSPFVINGAMRDIENVIQYQFVQHEQGRYSMRIVAMPGFAQEELIRGRLLRILGSEAKLAFEYVDEIPPLRSGKRPYVINEMAHAAGAEDAVPVS